MCPSSHASALATSPAAGLPRRGRGFTLIELLVAVGIIVVLISMLLPTIGAARRQARTTHCLSNLRQIGQGFRAYASAYDGAWPVAVHLANLGPPAIRIPNERRWYDLVGPFVTENKNMRRAEDIYIPEIRRESVLWGCPEWSRTLEGNVEAGDNYRPGYGMNPYGNYFDITPLSTSNWVQQTGVGAGKYWRQEQWKPSNRLVLADSSRHVIQMSNRMNPNDVKWAPYDTALGFDGSSFYVEARHGKPALGRTAAHKKMSYSTPCLGALFVDGSVMLVSVKEAWMAIRNPTNDPQKPQAQ